MGNALRHCGPLPCISIVFGRHLEFMWEMGDKLIIVTNFYIFCTSYPVSNDSTIVILYHLIDLKTITI